MNYRTTKKYSIILILIAVLVGLSNCSKDREVANEKKSKECLRILSLQALKEQAAANSTLTSEQSAILAVKNIKFSYSCSAESNSSPSCKEFHLSNSEDRKITDSCEFGFQKKSAKCSSQNKLGNCRIFLSTNDGYEIRVYASPNDTEESAIRDCSLSKGNFTPKEGTSLIPPLLLACELP